MKLTITHYRNKKVKYILLLKNLLVMTAKGGRTRRCLVTPEISAETLFLVKADYTRVNYKHLYFTINVDKFQSDNRPV